MGKIVHTYELLEQLGQGGMGVVYKARHINFNEIFALKRLWEQYGSNELVKKLFFDEGRILRKLHHKNIVEVSDLFEFDGSYYIVMEYIEGRSLHEIVKRETGPIRQERAISLFKQMLEGMAFVHNQNPPIIHRDIKPLNILVAANDALKITDFGIAKALDASGQSSTLLKGTPVYMSPEQIIAPSTVDIRTDVYSLGMTFYEMLCGHTPFESDKDMTPTSVYATVMNGKVLPPTHFYPGITKEIEAFVMKAILNDRSQRFASADEMLHELERLERSKQTTLIETKPANQKEDKKYIPKKPEFQSDARNKIDIPKSNSVSEKEKHKASRIKSFVRYFGLMVVVIFGLLLIMKVISFKSILPDIFVSEVSKVDTILVDTLNLVSVQGDSLTYVGRTFKGKANGEGEAFFRNGNKYTGTFIDNHRNGKGIFSFHGGGNYEGDWENDRMNGAGKYLYEDNSYYIGSFKDDLLNGNGTYYDKFGNVLQKGYWQNDTLTSNEFRKE